MHSHQSAQTKHESKEDMIPSEDSCFLLENIGELVTNQPFAERLRGENKTLTPTIGDLGVHKDAWLAVKDGKVEAYGINIPPNEFRNRRKYDAKGQLVLPGLIDCHTHAIFAGDRTDEFARRVNGETYADIAAKGGGIQSTIRATRNASDQTLYELTRSRLDKFLRHGVTTVEVKSGYGQNPEQELRILRVLQRIAQNSAQTIQTTCLALHAIPKGEYPDTKTFVDDMTNNLLPHVANEKLANWVDAFIENAYFTPDDAEEFFAKAKSLGLKTRIHADEFEDSQAAIAASSWQCISADHLQKANREGLEAMARSGTIAVLLPGTSLYTAIDFTSAAPIRQSGCTIAIASDFNPGSCYLSNLPFLVSIASLHNGLSLAESILGVTFNAARALDLHDRKGSLAKGFDADLCIYPFHSKESWLADFGQTLARDVFIAGKKLEISN